MNISVSIYVVNFLKKLKVVQKQKAVLNFGKQYIISLIFTEGNCFGNDPCFKSHFSLHKPHTVCDSRLVYA